MTRIVENLVQQGYIKRSEHSSDGRRSKFILTKGGIDTFRSVQKIVHQNRKHALEDIDIDKIEFTKTILEKVITNCSK